MRRGFLLGIAAMIGARALMQRLLRGEGRYTDDMNLPNQAWCVMVRSQVAHGVIRSIDTADAKTMPGVLGVWTGADLADYGPLKTLIPVFAAIMALQGIAQAIRAWNVLRTPGAAR